MAAATVDKKTTLYAGTDTHVQLIQLSALTSDQNEDVAHGGPSGVAAALVVPVVTTPADSNDLVTCDWVRASDSTVNNTIRLKAHVENGGDITGAKLSVYAVFIGRASGGLNP